MIWLTVEQMAATPLPVHVLTVNTRTCRYTDCMVRFFERDGERIQCELRPSLHAAGFDLELVSPDGRRQLEHAADHNTMALKWLELEDKLKREGWVVIGERRLEQR